MIPARKLPPFNFVLRRWMTRLLRRRFHNVYVAGAEHLRSLDPTRPVVGCVNHTNWWDGFVLYVLSHRLLPHDIYLVMEEAHLRRYRFFTWMGVFGVDLAGRRAALPGVRYALHLLTKVAADGPAKLLWVFVQGRVLPPVRPVEVRPGATFLAARSGATLLPLVLRYEWLCESRPSILVRVGEPLAADTPAETLAGVLDALLAETDRTTAQPDLAAYEPLFLPAMSMNKRWDYFVHVCLRRRGVFDKENV